MKTKILTILICLTIFLSGPLYAKEPKRIVSLKPNITELLYAIGAGDNVIGVTTWCNKPEKAKSLPKVADYIKPNIEKIIVLKPDLVITSKENSIKNPIDVLEENGIPVLMLSFKTIDDLLSSINELGKATGHIKEAKALAGKMQLELRHCEPEQSEGEAIQKNSLCNEIASSSSSPPSNYSTSQRTAGTRNDETTTALIIVGKRPLIAAGPNTFLGEVIEIAGAKNIITSKMPYPHINMEMILDKNPDVIIDLSMGSEAETTYNTLKLWKGKIHTFDISNFRAGPRLGEQVERLRKIF